ncbi:MAG: tRNA adenosine(34) deaminase TadA [Candidatus Aminicenantales bacterium]
MTRDESFMRQALTEAEKAARQGEVPVGAVVVSGEKVLSRGRNASIRSHDPTAHAEIMALRKASLKAKNYRLEDCDLYVTLEPCAMCVGAVVQARIRRLVFGAYDPKSGAVESLMKFPFEKTNHRPEIRGGVLKEKCAGILKDFFQTRRPIP